MVVRRCCDGPERSREAPRLYLSLLSSAVYGSAKQAGFIGRRQPLVFEAQRRLALAAQTEGLHVCQLPEARGLLQNPRVAALEEDASGMHTSAVRVTEYLSLLRPMKN